MIRRGEKRAACADFSTNAERKREFGGFRVRLPNARRAYVADRKIVDYLLSETHAVGRAKAGFFRAVGFGRHNAAELKRALINVARTGTVVDVRDTPYGRKYVVDGMLHTPSGRDVRMRTVWIVERGRNRPRFVTAYPV